MQIIDIIGVRRGVRKDGTPYVQISYTEQDLSWVGKKAGTVFLDPNAFPDAGKVQPGDVADAVIAHNGKYVNCYHFEVKMKV